MDGPDPGRGVVRSGPLEVAWSTLARTKRERGYPDCGIPTVRFSTVPVRNSPCRLGLVNSRVSAYLRFHAYRVRALLGYRRQAGARRRNWIHEVKHDGYVVIREHERVRLLSRNGADWTKRYPGSLRPR